MEKETSPKETAQKYKTVAASIEKVTKKQYMKLEKFDENLPVESFLSKYDGLKQL